MIHSGLRRTAGEPAAELECSRLASSGLLNGVSVTKGVGDGLASREVLPEEAMTWTKTAVLITLWSAAASAGPITFTETQNGIGSLGGTPFNNALVTIVLTTDTSTIFSPTLGL